MGLIKCPDCNKMFSDRIEACPECGCPIEEAIKEQNASQDIEVKDNNTKQEPLEDELEEVEDVEEIAFEKMSSIELNDFAIRAIIPELKRELDCNDLQLFKNDEISYPGLLIKAGSNIIWMDVIVEVAPMFKSYIVNWENAKKADEKGWKYAVAHIAIGARDTIRFERRVVLRNDEYYVRYEGLKFFDYPKYSNTRITLSEDSYDFIYKRESGNPFAIVKEVEDYRKTYFSDVYKKTIDECWEKYSFPIETKEFLMKYFDEIGEAIDYRISLKDVILNFWYCIDCCKGLLLADSVPISKKNIIPTCNEMLDNNTLIDLPRYDRYLFAYMVYYYLTSGEHLSEFEHSGYLNQQKIKLFEERPGYFGFYDLVEKKRKDARDNSSENVFNMYLRISNYLANDFPLYMELNMEVNADSKKKLVDFRVVINRFKELLSTAEKNYHYLICNFDKDKSFKGKELYLQFYKVSWEYMELLKKDCRMFEKLLAKSNGGKYGFFDYKKDSKERDEKLKMVLGLTETLKRSFHMPEPSREAKIMVPICSKYFEGLKEEYVKEIKDNPVMFEGFRNKLCEFYEEALHAPYERAYASDREFFVMNITKFIELLEMKEKNSADEDAIYDKEEEIFDDMEVIRENTYRMLVE